MFQSWIDVKSLLTLPFLSHTVQCPQSQRDPERETSRIVTLCGAATLVLDSESLCPTTTCYEQDCFKFVLLALTLSGPWFEISTHCAALQTSFGSRLDCSPKSLKMTTSRGQRDCTRTLICLPLSAEPVLRFAVPTPRISNKFKKLHIVQTEAYLQNETLPMFRDPAIFGDD
jgi:hypothetical protein